jgi:hypothetical protein
MRRSAAEIVSSFSVFSTSHRAALRRISLSSCDGLSNLGVHITMPTETKLNNQKLGC